MEDRIRSRFWNAAQCIERYETTFDASKADYTASELETFADAILLLSSKEEERGNLIAEHGILMPHAYRDRYRREIFNQTGVANPAVMEGLSPDGQRMFHRVTNEGKSADKFLSSQVQALHRLGHDPMRMKGRDKRIQYDYRTNRWRAREIGHFATYAEALEAVTTTFGKRPNSE